MKTLQEVIDWVDEEMADALREAREESKHGPNNHLFTAYQAEYDILQRLKEFIEE